MDVFFPVRQRLNRTCPVNGCMVVHRVFSTINLSLLLIVTVSPFWMVCRHAMGDAHLGLWFSLPTEMYDYLAVTPGFCVLITMMIMHFWLRLLNDSGIAQVFTNWAFFLSVVICALSFLLGVLSLVWYHLLDSAQQKLGTQRDPIQGKEPTLRDFMDSFV